MHFVAQTGETADPAVSSAGGLPLATAFVIEPDPGHSAHLRSQLTSMGVVAKTFSSADEYWRSFDSRQPGCLILDVHASVGGVYLRDRLAGSPLAPPLVYLSSETDVACVVNAMRHGAIDFLQKRTYGETDLWEAVQRAFQADAKQRAKHARRQELLNQLSLLSESEVQVMERLARGKNNREIAEELGITRAAVEGRRTRLMKKIGLVSVVSLVRFAIEVERDVETREMTQSSSA
jgi:FixJ family two-component response regulator